MKIYIAKSGDNQTIGIVLAMSQEIAHAYFTGRGEIPHSMLCMDPKEGNLGVMGLVTLFKTKQIPGYVVRDRNPDKIRMEEQ